MKIKSIDKTSHHKKIRKFEILNKYNSLFHQKISTKKEFDFLNRQNYISSVSLKELPKTLQAYYSVSDTSRNHISSFSSINSTQSPPSSSHQSTFNNIEDYNSSQKLNFNIKGSGKNQQRILNQKNLQSKKL